MPDTPDNLRFQLIPPGCLHTSRSMSLHYVPDLFSRIELRRVRGKIEHANFPLKRLNICEKLFRPMRGMAIKNQENRA